MRIALFHNLPPGGGRRAAYELARYTAERHEYDLYRIDMGGADRFVDDTQRSRQDLSRFASRTCDYSLGRRWRPGGTATRDLHRIVDVVAIRRLQRSIAADIDAGDYALALVHPCQLTQAPPILSWLRTPSLYFMQEPRRQSFEYALARRRRATNGRWDRAARQTEAVIDGRFAEADIRAARAADTIVVNSYYSAEAVIRSYGRYPRVCHLGVDPSIFRLGDRTDRDGVLSVGALHAIKGHDLVIDAVGLLPAEHRPAVHLVYEREYPGYIDVLRNLASVRQVDVTFHRSLPDVELAELYRTVLATFCCAILEPFGLTTIESLASGTPVIAVQEGGFREVVSHGVNGYLVDRDAGSLSQAFRSLLEQGEQLEAATLRDSVLPYWSWEAAAERFDRILTSSTMGRE